MAETDRSIRPAVVSAEIMVLPGTLAGTEPLRARPVAFATAAQWADRLAAAHQAGRLQEELVKLGRYPLIVIDEVGYIPFEAEAANLFFQLISNRCERASVIVPSNKPFGRWGEVFGDETVGAAMIDRLVHHAEVHSLKGESYRMRGRELGRVPTDDNN
ncbi:ATP-binding protein [Kitasatospora sp. NPDC085464]|uniref:ATP-binding protein n=1 Tax=Kitasatospora sp. NPDC085464 TaxID=3364063 RepID=UPI0037CB07D2